MRHDPPFLIELENEQTAKLLVVTRIPTKPLGDLVNLFATAATGGFATRSPANDEFLGADCRGDFFVRRGRRGRGRRGQCREVVASSAVFHDTLGEDCEADVADYRDSTPCYGGRPEGGVVGDAAGDGGEMGMCRGEEVETYVG